MGMIGVFDSGVGGLTIAAAIRQQLPLWPIAYLSDNECYPYGTKPEVEVTQLTTNRSLAFCNSYPLSLLVIACNTASTISLPTLREKLSIPVVGVVPAIKPASVQSKNKKIGLLATPGTVNRSYTDDLIRQFAQGVEVVRVGTRVLVDMAEAKLRGQKVDLRLLKQEVDDLFAASVDTVVLGCTHFPLLLDELKQVSPYDILWVDSGDAIASRCTTLLTDLKPDRTLTDIAVFTKEIGNAGGLKEYLQKLGYDRVATLG